MNEGTQLINYFLIFHYIYCTDLLQTVTIAGKKLFVATGDQAQYLDWEDMGLKIHVPSGTLSPNDSCEIATFAFVGGRFSFPAKTDLVSTAYAVAVSKPLNNPIQIELQHCVELRSIHQTAYLSMTLARSEEIPYKFELVQGGSFYPGNSYGCYSYSETGLKLIGILRLIK